MSFYTSIDLSAGSLTPKRTSPELSLEIIRAEPAVSLNNGTAAQSLASENEALQSQVFALGALVESIIATIDDTSERMRSACAADIHEECECSALMSDLLKKVELMKRMATMHVCAELDSGAGVEH